jgi:hypothetical protein
MVMAVGVVTTHAAAADAPLRPVQFGFVNRDQLFNCQSGDRVSLDPSGPQPNILSMRWDARVTDGKPRICRHAFNQRIYRGAERVRFASRSTTSGKLVIQFIEEDGETFTTAVATGPGWTSHAFDLSSLLPDEATKRNGTLDVDHLARVALIDGPSLSGVSGTRTYWIADWFFDVWPEPVILPAQLPVTSRPYYLSALRVDLEGTQGGGYTAAMDQFIAAHTDLVTHHLELKIPWQEALENTLFPPELMAAWQSARDSTPPGHKIFLAINPLDFPTRTQLVNPTPWGSDAINHPNVKIAFLNYTRRIVDFFQPDYLAIGIEVNLALTRNPTAWAQYLDLHRHIYTQLKRTHPTLPIFASIVYPLLLGPDRAVQAAELVKLLAVCDLLGLSVHPHYASQGGPLYPLPENHFDAAVLFGKPIAITETSYPSRSFIWGGRRLVYSKRDQYNYLELLLRKAAQYRFVFVAQAVTLDFDQLMVSWPENFQDVLLPFAYTGLQESDGDDKPALDLWDAYLSLPRR